MSVASGEEVEDRSSKSDLAIATPIVGNIDGARERGSEIGSGPDGHARISTTMDISALFVAEAQWQAVERTMAMEQAKIARL